MAKTIVHHGNEPQPDLGGKYLHPFEADRILSAAIKWNILQNSNVRVGPGLEGNSWSWDYPSIWVITERPTSSFKEVRDYIPWQVHVWEQSDFHGVAF